MAQRVGGFVSYCVSSFKSLRSIALILFWINCWGQYNHGDKGVIVPPEEKGRLRVLDIKGEWWKRMYLVLVCVLFF